MGAMNCDCLVIGAGFGGLGAALTLAEGGAKVIVCEALNYPGGCASTFLRAGHSFESGATLFSGFDSGQLFASWISKHRLEVKTVALDPIVELRAPGFVFPIPGKREALIDQMCALPNAPEKKLRAFFSRQKKVADTLWPVLDTPDLLPPLKARALAHHALHAGRYAFLTPLIGQPLLKVLEEEGVASFPPLRLFVDAVCQITVQAPAAEAEAVLALSALDYFFRGTRHVQGGIGALAFALTSAITKLGSEVKLANAVKKLERLPDGRWQATTRAGVIEAKSVIANLLPQDLRKLCATPIDSKPLDQIAEDIEGGWGAVMLYRALPSNRFGASAKHLELVRDPNQLLVEGNHLFCSVSAQDEKEGGLGTRSVTISTHVALKPFRALDSAGQGAAVAKIQAQMRETITLFAPELDAPVLELTASPRTFARFTRRHLGAVGGIPRRAGLHNYRQLSPLEAAPGLFLVGDSVFPGQSTLATATGGQRVATALLSRLR